MRIAFSALVFALGFFSLVAQTLVFRDYLSALEGSELAVGAFFGTWLVWVALGALAGRFVGRRIRAGPALAAAALLYVPAFVLQVVLIAEARSLAGATTYDTLDVGRLLAVSLLVNAPVSCLTGFFFTAACRAAAAHKALPVARVYVLECLGGFAGGLVVTLLLAAEWTLPAVFGVAALVLTAAVAACGLRRRRPATLAFVVPVLLVAAGLTAGLDGRWADARDRAAWAPLPTAGLRGAFATGQARYLYGEHEGAFHVVSRGATVEAFPDRAHGGEVAAIHVAQHPTARRVLVVGANSLAIASAFAALPSIEAVAWAHPDPAYAKRLWSLLPEKPPKTRVLDADVRTHLRELDTPYDLILLNLPDVSTLVENRHLTLEFYREAAEALRPDGVVSLRLTGGENVLGPELRLLGASAMWTLYLVFSDIELKPGEATWMFASNGEGLTSEPEVLRDRWAAVAGAETAYPPEALPGLFPPDRARRQMARYSRTMDQGSQALLLNTHAHPKALLHGLAVGVRRQGHASVAERLVVLLDVGAWVLAAGALLYVLLRAAWLGSVRRRAVAPAAVPAERPFDAVVLVGTTGAAAMGLAVVLMFAYQTRFGSLYVDVGLVSALFMLGLFAGGAATERHLARRDAEPGFLHLAAVVLLGAVLAVVALLPGDASRPFFVLLFALSGLVTGAFVPLGAHRLRAAGWGAGRAGAALDAADHLGGAVGAVTVGVFCLPLFGAETTLLLLGGLAVVSLAPRLVPRRLRAFRPLESAADRGLRAAGYVVLGVAAWVVVGAVLASFAREGQAGRRFWNLARELAPDGRLEEEVARAPDGRFVSGYLLVKDQTGAVSGWIFSTAHLAEDVVGYGGPIWLAVHVDTRGRLLGTRVVASGETPAYLARVDEWRANLVGRDLFAAAPFDDVDTVTGATVTADAIRHTLERAGRRFAREVLGHKVAGGDAPVPRPFDWKVVVLLLFTAGAVLLRYLPRPWPRRVFLVTVLVVCGLWLNLQYSVHQVHVLLALEWRGLHFGAAFYLVLIVPLVVVLFGNVYCGGMCPFGALQELLGDIGRKRWETDPRRSVWRWGRAVKYGLLALVIGMVAWTGREEALAADPLVTFFGGAPESSALTLALVTLALALVFGRFWCRNLCPAGAFLALLNRVRLLRRVLPATRPGRCDLGVQSPLELDCICCDRCRHD